ncbi:Dbl homology domain-containing protein [Dendrothele bispora CBS 962.96]|uniref:Dbl homology domain-containing protein n=1 Tax=Dendrothele bispora (strain CBS 962.96) TaxID=1314807 RepID=A0A4V4HEL7_DENBC|nr:Dbl homology domain-containing protein [Dendrothele bispora CBS 962.96]
MAITLFAMNARRMLECEYFTIAELSQENATEGLQKAIQALFAILRLLPEPSFEEQSTPASLESPKPSFSNADTLLNSSRHITQFSDDAVWKTHLRSILHSERQYVQEIEMLENYSSRLFDRGTESVRNTISHVFHKNFFAFVRKFCIQVECAAQTPSHDQRWGRLFTENATDIQILYTIYCVNYILAEEELAEQDAKLRSINAHTWTSELISKLLDRPFQRLSEYVTILNKLMLASDSEATHYDELVSGRDKIKEVVEKVAVSRKRARTELVVKRLGNRVPEWRDIASDTGQFHLKGNFLTSTAAILAPSKSMFLDTLHCILTNEIEYVTVSLQNNGGSFSKAYASDIISSPSIYELAISTSTEDLVLLLQRQERAQLWQKSIEECRTETLSLEVKNTLFVLPTSRLHSPHDKAEQKVTNETTSRFAAMSVDNRILVRLELGNGDFLTVSVDVPVTYEDLMERIWRKLKMCRRRTQVQYPRVLYRDTDGREQALTPKKDLTSIFSQTPVTVLHVQ